MLLTHVIISAVLPFWGDWYTLDFHLAMKIWGIRSVHELYLLSRTIFSSFLNMIEINCKDEEWWNMCADIYTWHLNDKWKLIITTMMLPSSFSGSIFIIIISINLRPYDFLQQIMKKILCPRALAIQISQSTELCASLTKARCLISRRELKSVFTREFFSCRRSAWEKAYRKFPYWHLCKLRVHNRFSK